MSLEEHRPWGVLVLSVWIDGSADAPLKGRLIFTNVGLPEDASTTRVVVGTDQILDAIRAWLDPLTVA